MKIRFFATLLAVITILSSCKKNKDDDTGGGSSYPKSVSIEYRITSTDVSILREAGFTNAGGGLTDESNVALPFSRKISRTVNRYDFLTLKGAGNAGGTIKLEIIVDNKVVVSTPFSSTTTVVGISSHIFN